MQIIQQFRLKKRDHDLKKGELKICEDALADCKSRHEALREKRHKQFKEGFDEIAKHVKQIYRLITDQGDAELEVID